MKKDFYTTFEVAQMCHVSPGSVIRWVHEGKLQASLTAGGHHRIKAEDIKSFLKSLRMPIPAELGEKEQTVALIVDDEANIRSVVRVALMKYFPEMAIEEAEDGFLAGAKVTSFRPDLVILDIKLPGLDGFRVCQFIKENSELKHTKVLVITGMDPEEARDKILKLGADDFLSKPFEIEMLVEKINRLLPSLRRA